MPDTPIVTTRPDGKKVVDIDAIEANTMWIRGSDASKREADAAAGKPEPKPGS